MNFHYTAHYNWQWVVTAAADKFQKEFESLVYQTNDCKRYRLLPSSQSDDKKKAEYSLFRVDLVSNQADVLAKIRLSSQGFADLDPKDALFRRLKDSGAVYCMPESILISWDAADGDLPETLPFVPSLLKAPMGSGGFGLYYVYHPRDIVPILKNHRLRAEREPHFMENLINSYGGAQPSWSLQEVITSVKGSVPIEDNSSIDKRRTQIRVYVVLCDNQLFLYDGVEVRMPLWDCDIDEVLAQETAAFSSNVITEHHSDNVKQRRPWLDTVEEECCGEGNARPYNEQRNKKETCRFMLEEIPELITARDEIVRCVQTAFIALKDSILQRHLNYLPENIDGVKEVSMAVVGVDLLATHYSTDSHRIVMVEVNNNPAMPGEKKQMSDSYRQHLIDMVDNIMQLGVAHSLSASFSVDQELNNVQKRALESLKSNVFTKFHSIG
jgi:hypothetical protein